MQLGLENSFAFGPKPGHSLGLFTLQNLLSLKLLTNKNLVSCKILTVTNFITV